MERMELLRQSVTPEEVVETQRILQEQKKKKKGGKAKRAVRQT